MSVVGLAALGLALLAGAAVGSPARLEEALLGEASGRLAWGPLLFRALLVFHGLACLVAAAWRARRPAPLAASRHAGEPLLTWPIGLTCAAALALRLWRLDTGLWFDEVLTLVDFIRLPLREIVAVFPNQNQHMLYTILAHLSTSLFGESAAAARLPAVLFGVGSIWAIFLLGRRLVGERQALLASLLTTVSYHHVWFSQNARGYTGLLFFTVLSTWLWLDARSRGGAALWTAYAASLCLGLYVHLTMVFVWMAHAAVTGLDLLLTAAGDRRRGATPDRASAPWAPIGAYLFATTVSLQLYALSLPEFLASALHEESLESQWTNPLWAVTETLRRLQDAGLAGLVAVGGLAVMALGWWSIGRRDWRAALMIALPPVLGGGITIALGHNIWPRFFFFCMGFAILAAVHGVFVVLRFAAGRLGLRGPERLSERLGLAAMTLLIVLSATTLPRCYALPKQDFAGARDYVVRTRGPHDGFAAVGLAGSAFRRYFALDWPAPATVAELEAIERRHPSTWLVYTLPIQLQAWHPDIWDRIEAEYEVVTSFPGTLGGGAVVVCRRGVGK